MSAESIPTSCDQAVENLYALLDEELTPDVRQRVQQHFDECAHCFPLYRFERSFSRFLKARAGAFSAPVSLRRQVFEALLLESEDKRFR